MHNILWEKRDDIGYVTIHRPDAMNCFDLCDTSGIRRNGGSASL
ncbi:hypothetical protein [Anoxybacillus sp. J5B_2022]|nr:hypothetical protein [Anoxybacillus sp. J5B_2022]MCZ0755006.1 hypothetical protein [Anoxybacillus sp. J5B_2022]